MSRVHNVIVGDKIANLSIKYYGTASRTGLIVNANPQLKGRPTSLENLPTIYPGDVLNIPDETINIVNLPEKRIFPDTIPVTERDGISFLLDGQIFSYYTTYEIDQRLESFDSIETSIPFDETGNFIDVNFTPFSYKDIGVYYDGSLLFGGTLLSPRKDLNPSSKVFSLTLYPKCGVLNDCSVPDSLYPIEFENQNLQNISRTLLQPFGVDAVFVESPGNPFKRLAPEPDETIMNFLIDPSKQRGLILSNTAQGNLLFYKSLVSGESVSNFKEGEFPLISCFPNFNPQEYFSHITGILPVEKEKDSEKYTYENRFLISKGILRPYTFIVEDSDSSDLRSAVEAKAARMFGAVCSYTISIQGHRDSNGNLLKKNTLINVLAPGGMIYKDTQFLIKNVKFTRNAESGDISTIEIVLPQSYAGQIPEVLPWEQ